MLGSQLRSQKKGPIEDLLRASRIHLNDLITKTALQEFFFASLKVTIGDNQATLLTDAVQDRVRSHNPTFGDLALMLIIDHVEPSNDPQEAENRSSRLFMFGCLETLGHTVQRIALSPQVALRYFLKNNEIHLQEFLLCMMSLSYDPNKLRFGVELLERYFSLQGGRHLTELQMIILIDQATAEVVIKGQLLQEGISDIVL